MSQSRAMLIGLPMSVAAFMLTYSQTNSKLLAAIPAALTMVLAVLAVWYSPYPDSTHHFGAGVKRQKWGFTSEQDGDKWIREPSNRGKQ